MTVFLFICSAMFFGEQASGEAAARSASSASQSSLNRVAAPLLFFPLNSTAGVAARLAILIWEAPIAVAEGSTLCSFTEEILPLSASPAPQEALRHRDHFAARIKLGSLDKFDDSNHMVRFKRNAQEGSYREPGPLEDEATAAAARNALASKYAGLALPLKLSCTSGNVSLHRLPDDEAQAAAVMDIILALDGVRTVQANLPASLRVP